MSSQAEEDATPGRSLRRAALVVVVGAPLLWLLISSLSQGGSEPAPAPRRRAHTRPRTPPPLAPAPTTVPRRRHRRPSPPSEDIQKLRQLLAEAYGGLVPPGGRSGNGTRVDAHTMLVGRTVVQGDDQSINLNARRSLVKLKYRSVAPSVHEGSCSDFSPPSRVPWCFSSPVDFQRPIPGKLVRGGRPRPHSSLATCPYLTSAFGCGELGLGSAAESLARLRFLPRGCTLRSWRRDFLRLLACRLRGRRLVFAGDSITGQHFIAFACMARAAARPVKEDIHWENRWDPDGEVCGVADADCGDTPGDFLVAAGVMKPDAHPDMVMFVARRELQEKLRVVNGTEDPQHANALLRGHSTMWGLRCSGAANASAQGVAAGRVTSAAVPPCVTMKGERASLSWARMEFAHNVTVQFQRVVTIPPHKLGPRGIPPHRVMYGRVMRELGLKARDVVVGNTGIWWDPFVERDRRIYTSGMEELAGRLGRDAREGTGPVFIWRETTPQFFRNGPGGLYPALARPRTTKDGCRCLRRWSLLAGSESRRIIEPDAVALDDNDTGVSVKAPKSDLTCGGGGGCCRRFMHDEPVWCFVDQDSANGSCAGEHRWGVCSDDAGAPSVAELRTCGRPSGRFDNWRNDAVNAAFRREGIRVLHVWNMSTAAPTSAVMAELTRPDCSHFCQPGLPEVWSDVLLSALHYV